MTPKTNRHATRRPPHPPRTCAENSAQLPAALTYLARDTLQKYAQARSCLYTREELQDYFALRASPPHPALSYKTLPQVFQPRAWKLLLDVSDNPYMAGLLLASIGQFLAPDQQSINIFQVRKAIAAVREVYFYTDEYTPLLIVNDQLRSFISLTFNPHALVRLAQCGAVVTSGTEEPRWNSILTFRHAAR